MTFTLFDPSNAQVYTETSGVNGNGTYQTTGGHVFPTAIGTYHWKVDYSGDDNNMPVTSDPASEPVVIAEVVQFTITITPTPAHPSVGSTLNAIITISGAISPTGRMYIELLAPAPSLSWGTKAAPQANGSFSTQSNYIATTPGIYRWRVEYGDDLNNVSPIVETPVNVAPSGSVLAATGYTPLALALAEGLMAAGLLAMVVAFAWRRRQEA